MDRDSGPLPNKHPEPRTVLQLKPPPCPSSPPPPICIPQHPDQHSFSMPCPYPNPAPTTMIRHKHGHTATPALSPNPSRPQVTQDYSDSRHHQTSPPRLHTSKTSALPLKLFPSLKLEGLSYLDIKLAVTSLENLLWPLVCSLNSFLPTGFFLHPFPLQQSTYQELELCLYLGVYLLNRPVANEGVVDSGLGCGTQVLRQTMSK